MIETPQTAARLMSSVRTVETDLYWRMQKLEARVRRNL